ncbi:MAG: hypothetical protein Q8Q14_04720 [Gemmatimonadales bacterium]|nr:hypothetical protein [Gemmatimonadales bacterium]
MTNQRYEALTRLLFRVRPYILEQSPDSKAAADAIDALWRALPEDSPLRREPRHRHFVAPRGLL